MFPSPVFVDQLIEHIKSVITKKINQLPTGAES